MTSNSLPYSVPPEPGRFASIALAVIMHALLFAFLWIGINWVSETPQSIDPDFVFTQQELDTPPPEPVVPVPVPKVEDRAPVDEDAEIKTAQEKKRLKEEQEAQEKAAQQKKLEERRKQEELQKQKEQEEADKKREEAEKKAAEKKQQLEEQKKLDKIAAEDRKRMMAGGSPTTGSQTTSGGPGKGDAGWGAKVKAKIKSLIIFDAPPGANPDATVEFAVKLLPDGSVASVRQTKSSGIPAFDQAVERAINAAAPYPPDNTGIVPKSFTSSHRLADKQ
ncbi:MAG: TonB family protein [Burkholderiaceae bacterium]|nr:TonB family protein [Burkholderiaceae bacterium]